MQTGHGFCWLMLHAIIYRLQTGTCSRQAETQLVHECSAALAADPGEEGGGAVAAGAEPTGSPCGQELGGADGTPVFSAAEHGPASGNHSSGELGCQATPCGVPCMGSRRSCFPSSVLLGAGQPLLRWLGWPPRLCGARSAVCGCRSLYHLSSLLLSAGLPWAAIPQVGLAGPWYCPMHGVQGRAFLLAVLCAAEPGCLTCWVQCCWAECCCCRRSCARLCCARGGR